MASLAVFGCSSSPYGPHSDQLHEQWSKANAAYEAGRYDEAARECDAYDAIPRSSGDPPRGEHDYVYFLRGAICTKQGRWDAADRFLRTPGRSPNSYARKYFTELCEARATPEIQDADRRLVQDDKDVAAYVMRARSFGTSECKHERAPAGARRSRAGARARSRRSRRPARRCRRLS